MHILQLVARQVERHRGVQKRRRGHPGRSGSSAREQGLADEVQVEERPAYDDRGHDQRLGDQATQQGALPSDVVPSTDLLRTTVAHSAGIWLCVAAARLISQHTTAVEAEALLLRVLRHAACGFGAGPVPIPEWSGFRRATAALLVLLLELSHERALASVVDRHQGAFAARQGAAVKMQTYPRPQPPRWRFTVATHTLQDVLRSSPSRRAAAAADLAEQVAVEGPPAEDLGVAIVDDAPRAQGERRDADAARARGEREHSDVSFAAALDVLGDDAREHRPSGALGFAAARKRVEARDDRPGDLIAHRIRDATLHSRARCGAKRRRLRGCRHLCETERPARHRAQKRSMAPSRAPWRHCPHA
mmetsp:Transcript_52262/g.169802  ORF Transcript_52262/g.169802 Transcript_52262/m.169802 type:complete len:361 (-) Transcript_52262:36-1118(-)